MAAGVTLSAGGHGFGTAASAGSGQFLVCSAESAEPRTGAPARSIRRSGKAPSDVFAGDMTTGRRHRTVNDRIHLTVSGLTGIPRSDDPIHFWNRRGSAVPHLMPSDPRRPLRSAPRRRKAAPAALAGSLLPLFGVPRERTRNRAAVARRIRHAGRVLLCKTSGSSRPGRPMVFVWRSVTLIIPTGGRGGPCTSEHDPAQLKFAGQNTWVHKAHGTCNNLPGAFDRITACRPAPGR